MTDHVEVPAALVARVRSLCGALPETFEESAWVGTRWKIRTKTFAHVVHVESGWPPAYARALGDDGPADVLTFRSSGAELAALSDRGLPFFKPVWFTDIVGLVLDAQTDWDEMGELLTESYCLLAPKRLAASVRPPDV